MNECLQSFSLPWRNSVVGIQLFSQKSHAPTVAKEYQIGLYDPEESYDPVEGHDPVEGYDPVEDPAEADLELFCNSWSAGFLGERL